MKYELTTDGERLAYTLNRDLLGCVPWHQITLPLMVTGRGEELTEFFREVSVINLTCRIIRGGTSLLKKTDQRPARMPDDPTFERDYRSFLRERLSIPHDMVDQIQRMGVRAVLASREEIDDKTRRQLTGQAQRTHNYCYMCGQPLDFSGADPIRKYQLEHVWPQCYGGNSIADNLLPACGSCNGKKDEFATWAMVGVQSLILGFDPSENEFTRVTGPHRFALHYFMARQLLARNPQMNLKRAFQRLQPWRKDFRLRDSSDLGDFFNLENHEPIPGVV